MIGLLPLETEPHEVGTLLIPAPTRVQGIQQWLNKRSSSDQMNLGWESISTDHPDLGQPLSLCLLT